MKFNIDFFELMFLAEACIPPRPIARAMFWDELCDKHYQVMTEGQRLQMFQFLKDKIDLNNEDCRYFFARFNPLNQYLVSSFFDGKAGQHEAFMFNEKFHTSKNRFINPEYVKEWKKK